ncbi:uncharacterized protein LY79DRAFT_31462 [Colletotrichum navitas]|uniref:Uncharacterized protein n=1 Tax=Colletotrichum navitas TaxID=681940 RepID=A0AAD8Q6X6_9PEZI|nr:uncharacterized protein LY79DRAFT_31462 [Colletotrichum navitas]KAK1596800.1 hypothetical protein LY79DRAFT_31462 [Colletotrichum navitas]
MHGPRTAPPPPAGRPGFARHFPLPHTSTEANPRPESAYAPLPILDYNRRLRSPPPATVSRFEVRKGGGRGTFPPLPIFGLTHEGKGALRWYRYCYSCLGRWFRPSVSLDRRCVHAAYSSAPQRSVEFSPLRAPVRLPGLHFSLEWRMALNGKRAPLFLRHDETTHPNPSHTRSIVIFRTSPIAGTNSH